MAEDFEWCMLMGRGLCLSVYIYILDVEFITGLLSF